MVVFCIRLRCYPPWTIRWHFACLFLQLLVLCLFLVVCMCNLRLLCVVDCWFSMYVLCECCVATLVRTPDSLCEFAFLVLSFRFWSCWYPSCACIVFVASSFSICNCSCCEAPSKMQCHFFFLFFLYARFVFILLCYSPIVACLLLFCLYCSFWVLLCCYPASETGCHFAGLFL